MRGRRRPSLRRPDLEALVSIVARLIAGSVSLVGFGLDNVIEVVSGATMLWRLHHEATTISLSNAYNRYMGSAFDRWVTLRDDIERSRLDFIRTDLQVCLTLASLAGTEYCLGNREHAARTTASAEKGYSTLLRYFSQAKRLTSKERKELQLTFARLRERLDLLQRRK